MVLEVSVDGLAAFQTEANKHKDKTIFALFSGTPDSTGQNWCPDCVKADPVVKAALSQAPDDAVFIHCGVGDKPTWKDSNNEFRKDPVLSLNCVPTLIKVGTKQRLREGECASADLVGMMFSDE